MKGGQGRLLLAAVFGLLAGAAVGVAIASWVASDAQPAPKAAAIGAGRAVGRGSAASDCERVALPSRPNGLALVGNQIWVAEGRTVGLVDLEACSISGEPVRMPTDATIPAPPGQPGTVRGPDEAGGVVADGRHLWVVGLLTIYRADQTTRQITTSVPLPVLGITLRGRSLWAANLAEGPTYLYKLEADTGRVRLKRRVADIEIVGMTAGGGRIWAISHDRGTLLRINPSSGRFTRTRFRSDPHGIAFGAGYVWVAMYHQSSILRIDPRTGRVVGRPIRAGFPTEPMAAAGHYLWAIPSTGGFLADPRRHEVLKIDARSGRILKTFRAKGQPRAIVAVDGQAWVATTEPDELVRFGGSTSSPPYHGGGTRGHGRTPAITFLLQISPSRRVAGARACPRVLKLMYPSRTRGALPVIATENREDGCDYHHHVLLPVQRGGQPGWMPTEAQREARPPSLRKSRSASVGAMAAARS